MNDHTTPTGVHKSKGKGSQRTPTGSDAGTKFADAVKNNPLIKTAKAIPDTMVKGVSAADKVGKFGKKVLGIK